MNVEISAVPPQSIEKIADLVIPHLRRVEVQTNGRYLAEDMLAMCVEGRSFMFVAFTSREDGVEILGVVVCAINIYPRLKALFIQFIGGDRAKLWRQNMYNLLERFAIDHGCDRVEGVGRIGWLKWFPQAVPIAVMGEIDLVRGRGQFRPISTDGNTD